MNPIHWIFGGTAVGKKHFIRRSVENPTAMGFPEGLTAAAYADGCTDATSLVEQFKLSPIIVRWQWGREDALENAIKEFPDVSHVIYLLKVYPSVQVRRVLQREGGMKFNEGTLIREAAEVDLLVQKLSMRHGIPVRFIDATTEDYRHAG
jgi:hypothetical protein